MNYIELTDLSDNPILIDNTTIKIIEITLIAKSLFGIGTYATRIIIDLHYECITRYVKETVSDIELLLLDNK